MPRTVQATRYVTPFREGGSLPALVEADDLGLYVLKFRGAGQGPLALVAEIIAGEIGRKLGLNVPELVLMEVDAALGRNEPDEEIRDLLRASVGLNLGVDFLPGSVMFDPAAGDLAEPELASAAVWFDAFVTNVDRTARNPNILCWHKSLYFIDHVLLPWAAHIERIDRKLRDRLSTEVFRGILEWVPNAWLLPEPDVLTPADKRAGYVDFLSERLAQAPLFVKEAVRARTALV